MFGAAYFPPTGPLLANWCSKTLPLDFLPLIIAQTDDQATLAALARLSERANKLVIPRLYYNVRLRTPQSHLRFFRYFYTRRKSVDGWPPRALQLLQHVRHMEICLDSRWVKDQDFASQRGRFIMIGEGLPVHLETLHVTTRGPSEVEVFFLEDFMHGGSQTYQLCDLVSICVSQISRSPGPKHFRWRHTDLQGNDAPFVANDELWWIAEKWTEVISIDWPLVNRPARAVLVVAQPDLKQHFEYLSVSGPTCTRRLLVDVVKQLERLLEAGDEQEIPHIHLDLRWAGVAEDDPSLQAIRHLFQHLPAGCLRIRIGDGRWYEKLRRDRVQEWRSWVVERLWRWEHEDPQEIVSPGTRGTTDSVDLLAPYIQQLELALPSHEA